MMAMHASAQKEVESSGYRLLLNTLLSHSVPEMSIQELSFDSGQYVLLDSREKKGFAVSHIQGAINVGYDDFSLDKVKDLDKNAAIVVYCSVGYRSEKISEKLISAGFKNVQNLYGGIFEWMNQGHELYNEQGKTDEIHVYSPTWGIWCNAQHKISD